MKYRNIIILAVLSFFCCSYAAAGGSSYSRYGFGDILRYGDSRIYSMGGTGIALLDNGSINLLNPAGISRINTTRFSAGAEYNSFSSKDESGSSSYSFGGFQGIAFAIPISPENGVAISLDATPYSKVSYSINSSNLDPLSGSFQHQTFYGSGGLSCLGLGISVSPFSTLHVGGRAGYIYGRIRQYQISTFDSSGYLKTEFDRSIYHSGFAFNFGAIYEGLTRIFDLPSENHLYFGFTIRTACSLDAEAERTYTDTTSIENGTAEIPLSAGIGLSFLYKNKYRFLGDIVIENWGDLKPFSIDPAELRNSYRASAGFEALPSRGADNFWKKLCYRVGFFYNSTYYKVNGIGINEYGFTGGIGLPLGYDSWLNIGAQAGFRGTTDNSLQKDMIVRLSVAITASELWFLKFDEE
ncbi:MAG: hypothetical protein JXA06_02495 [Bacteroidetes bacterium]|nr:hypothetical protein [Bacteroidota bacterium]